MGRATVRQAVAAYFAPPACGLLNRVFTAQPKRIEGSWFRYGQPAGTQSGAVGVVQIVREDEERIAIGGEHYGQKWVHYEVELQLFLHSIRTHSEDAMGDFDTLVDNVKAQLRADRRLNDYPVVFEAGERLLAGEYGEPRVLSDGSTEIWGAIRFEVSEVVTT
jgi:hypothetical protein